MLKTKAFFSTFLILFPILLGCLYFAYHFMNVPSIKHQSTIPDSYMLNSTTTRYNENGDPVNQLFAPEMDFYAKQSLIRLKTPRFTFYNAAGKPWIVTSDFGRYNTVKDKLILWQHVKLHRDTGKNNTSSTLSTNEMTIYPAKQIAITNKPVTITQPGSILHAIGMKVLAKQDKIYLLSKVRGQYDPKKANHRA